MQEGEQPVALIGLHHLEQHRNAGQHSDPADGQHAQAQPCQDDHRRPGHGQQHGGAQVRLLGDQQHRRRDHGHGNQELPREARLLGRQPMVKTGQGQDQADLHDLGRLDAHEVQVQPALGPQRHLALHHHRQEQHQADGVDRIGGDEPDADIHQGQGQGQQQAQAKTDQVLGRPWVPRLVGDGIEHQGANARDQAEHGAEGPVDLAELDDQTVALAWPGQGAGGHVRPFTGMSVGGGGSAPSAAPGGSAGKGRGVSMRARISGSLSRATRMISRAWAGVHPSASTA